MIAMKYCRAEVEIDEEIRKRHESLRQAQAVSVNKPQQPTSQTSRHARQVPVQGKCPNCGFSKNPSEARFCMQCGTKLT